MIRISARWICGEEELTPNLPSDSFLTCLLRISISFSVSRIFLESQMTVLFLLQKVWIVLSKALVARIHMVLLQSTELRFRRSWQDPKIMIKLSISGLTSPKYSIHTLLEWNEQGSPDVVTGLLELIKKYYTTPTAVASEKVIEWRTLIRAYVRCSGPKQVRFVLDCGAVYRVER